MGSKNRCNRTVLHQLRDGDALSLIMGILANRKEELLLHPDKLSRTALHYATSREVAYTLISSMCADRRLELLCAKDILGRTALFYARDAGVLEEILFSLPETLRQRYLLVMDAFGHSAAVYQTAEGLRTILSLCNDDSLNLMVNSRNIGDENLLQCFGRRGEVHLYPVILPYLNRCSMLSLTPPDCLGNSLSYSVACHDLETLAVILKSITLRKRRELLALRNKKCYSSLDLALTQPEKLRESVSERLGFVNEHSWVRSLSNFQGVSSSLLKVLHLLTNEYMITSRASIITHGMSDNTRIQLVSAPSSSSIQEVTTPIYLNHVENIEFPFGCET